MPFADDGGLISGSLQKFGKSLLRAVEGLAIIQHTIQMAIFAGEHYSAARRANGIGDQAIVKAHPFAPDAVDVRRVIESPSIGGDRLKCVVIGKEQDNVR